MTKPNMVLSAAICATLLSAAAQAGPEPDARRMELFRATCAHYANRRDAAGDSAAELFGRLAQSCERALAVVEAGPAAPTDRTRRALDYLGGLAGLKSTVVTMNMKRLFAPKGDAPVRTVSAAGEYLIAREMGILGAMDDFAGAGLDMAGGE